jgi:hypothetical protein
VAWIEGAEKASGRFSYDDYDQKGGGRARGKQGADGVADALAPANAASSTAYARAVAGPERRYRDDVPPEVERRLRALCLELPDAYEERAWVGTRWRVRTRTFAHVLGLERNGAPPAVVLAFRSAGEELEVLRQAGPPFFVLGWGRDALGMVLDDDTDWDEVREIVIESFCVMAPHKLVALVDRPKPAAP